MPVTFLYCARSQVAVERDGSVASSLALIESLSGATKAEAISTSFPPSLYLHFVCVHNLILS